MKRGGGRKKGQRTARTLAMIPAIRKMRSAGWLMPEIGKALGISKERVWMLCRDFGIGTIRPKGPKRYIEKYVPPPIDPRRAAQITEQKRLWWQNQERRSA